PSEPGGDASGPPARDINGSGKQPLFAVERVRTVALCIVLLTATVFFASFVNQSYAIGKWIFWHYAGYVLASLVFACACASTGHLLVKKVLGHTLPFREHLGTSFTAGVFVFYFVLSLLGFVHLYGAPLFYLLPASMLAAGGPSLFRLTRRYARGVAHLRSKRPGPPLLAYAIIAFSVIGFGLIYFNILKPDNLQFDSRWKHTALAEEYAASGGVRRFAEGWTVETNPHLATYVYLWGFLLPFGRLLDRIELAAHLEFTIFVATTLMIPALVRRMVPGTPARYAWVARFLFPG